MEIEKFHFKTFNNIAIQPQDIENVIYELDGIGSVAVSTRDHIITVEYDENIVTPAEVRAKLDEYRLV
ncbi:Heavy-metal-associated domain-containing protein [Geosporobacter subterraneus DSM 17957]|uniref:Heavy-metal-associated domain-containing protein n=1 Tax=Geosporobacter subterraneus DSM 17957 TaxID=1121919 RepID=A0A1M6N638_9FIRM|nr:heavy-metal-associated domain-containing protein [Geosporobacter subterraneus]SHJ91092.1 Heavy-metal-associated domain-containing protein [Geosporobacter subterraneus DSM 17957]